MIVLFEGPRLVGKTTLIQRVSKQLTEWGVPNQAWKDTRGEKPIDDMNAILDEGIFTDDMVWLLDRFHFSEWVISKASRRDAYPGSQWDLYEAGIVVLDERMASLNTLIVLVTSSPWMVDKRSDKLGDKSDPVGDSQKAQYWWTNSIGKTRCAMVHVINDRTNQLDQLTNLLVDLIYVRWTRAMPKEERLEVAKDLGGEAKEIEDEDSISHVGPGVVEHGTELSGGEPVDTEPVEPPSV